MEFHLPELGEGVYEAEMSRWLVGVGDRVKPGQGLLEVLTDKATMEVPAPFAGTIEALKVREGQRIKVGDVILSYGEKTQEDKHATPTIDTPASVPAAVATKTTIVSTPAPQNGPSEPVKAAPSVRVLARKLGIDINQVQGSGPDGRILIDDLTANVRSTKAAGPSAVSLETAPKERARVEANYGKPGTRLPLHGLRRLIAEHMVHAKRTIPHYTYVDEAEVTELVKVRTGLREADAARGVNITYMPFFVKAVVHALKEVPLVNASLDDAAGEIILHDQYHIGIAAATPAGLIVPVVHHADELSLIELAHEIDRLAAEARAGKSKRADLEGGTFTITSIGNIGGLFATPIIHHPQVGILGIGKIVKRPVFDLHGQVRAADMVYLSFSFDHRVLDGAIGTAFGNAVIKRLKNPVALLTEK